MHVVLRTTRSVGRLRRGAVYQALRRAIGKMLGKHDVRVVHVSIQHNHLHLLIEAESNAALATGMQALAIMAARAINRVQRRSGKVFAFRYHATPLRTPRQARNALAYVLNNWRRHREDCSNAHALAAKIDPYASGLAFAGWARRPRFEAPRGYVPLPVSPPATSLLRFNWQLFGLVDLYETPGRLPLT